MVTFSPVTMLNICTLGINISHLHLKYLSSEKKHLVFQPFLHRLWFCSSYQNYSSIIGIFPNTTPWTSLTSQSTAFPSNFFLLFLPKAFLTISLLPTSPIQVKKPILSSREHSRFSKRAQHYKEHNNPSSPPALQLYIIESFKYLF